MQMLSTKSLLAEMSLKEETTARIQILEARIAGEKPCLSPSPIGIPFFGVVFVGLA